MVTRSMLVVNNISEAVLDLSLPDEKTIRIQTTGMTFALGRHTPAKLAGVQIESANGKFVLPADVLNSHVSNSSFVDTQVEI